MQLTIKTTYDKGRVLINLSMGSFQKTLLWEIGRQQNPRWTVTLPVAAELGRQGGAATSEAKAAASRLNGMKGGRPPGKSNKD